MGKPLTKQEGYLVGDYKEYTEHYRWSSKPLSPKAAKSRKVVKRLISKSRRRKLAKFDTQF